MEYKDFFPVAYAGNKVYAMEKQEKQTVCTERVSTAGKFESGAGKISVSYHKEENAAELPIPEKGGRAQRVELRRF